MSFQIKTNLFGSETGPARIGDSATAVLVGVAAGVGTGALIWAMAVVRFGIPGWFWP